MASLLFAPSEHIESAKIARLVEFFGVPSVRMELAEAIALPGGRDAPHSRLICSARAFLELLAATEAIEDGARFWRETVHSAFVYASGDPAALQDLVRQVMGSDIPHVAEVSGDTTWFVSDADPRLCGTMSGLRVRGNSTVVGSVLELDSLRGDVLSIVSCEAGSGMLKFEYRGTPVIVATTDRVIDLDAELTHTTFDIRREFLSAVPIVMYIKWAFDAICWKPSMTAACVVIDDPLLKPRYGFLKFRELLDLMRVHIFSTSVAFIPWNWRRSSPEVVRLFEENADRLSLSVHGCDHTGGEFGSDDRRRTARRAKQAMSRMSLHRANTGLPFDKVMVFPQGVFSENAMRVLKHSGFIGTVNSDVVSSDAQPQKITVGDYWDLAVMNYWDFPIFTRRYPSDGVENFAFDMLLGKPCLVVIHHSDCRDDCKALVELVCELNRLNARLAWGNLGQVVRCGFRQRPLDSHVDELEMYGSEVRIQNTTPTRKRYRVHKREREPGDIGSVRATGHEIDWQIGDRQIAFELDLGPGESETVTIEFCDTAVDDSQGDDLRYRAKVMVRRYLSEVRDNYLSRLPFSD